MAESGRFHPSHPEKYVGDPKKIIYRSSWEWKFFRYCDSHPGVLQWASEEFFIPYVSPKDGHKHRYFPDIWMKVKTATGTKAIVVEIKPHAQTLMPKAKKRQTRRFMSEIVTYTINQAKWEAAEAFCQQKGWKFQVITEKHMPSFTI